MLELLRVLTLGNFSINVKAVVILKVRAQISKFSQLIVVLLESYMFLQINLGYKNTTKHNKSSKHFRVFEN